MTGLAWDDQPRLTRPVLLAAFEGWNDAAEAATSAVEWLRHRWGGRRFARIDAQEYFDFQSMRPQLVLVDGVAEELRWPANEFFAAPGRTGARDAVMLSGTEPSFRWRDFCDEILDVIERTGCEMIVTLGALLADVPHTRPVQVTGTAGDDDVAHHLGLEHSRYEGPTGIVGILHDACRRRGIPSVSLWAPVPHYVANPPNPVATLALLEAVGRLLDSPTGSPTSSPTGSRTGSPTGSGNDDEANEELRTAADEWVRKVDEAVADDEETTAYVAELERRYDEQLRSADLPSGDDLAAQIQSFLAGADGDQDGDPDGE